MNLSFLDRLRNPDADFSWYLRMLAMIVPLSLSFLIMIFLVSVVVIKKITGFEFVGTSFLNKFENVFIYSIMAIILVPYVTLKILHAYVILKLKKKGIPTGYLT